MAAPEDERRFTASDHTAAVVFCLREREKLAADATSADTVLRHAADIADGRVRRVLATAARRREHDAAPTVDGLRIGLRTALDLLEDGAQTIYRSGYWHEEGMLVAGFATDAAAAAAAREATALLADAGASAALKAGARSRSSTPDEVEQEVILAAIAASIPLAIVLAEGAHNQ